MEPNRETPQPNATAPHEQPAMLRITLASISDGVITTDTKGLVTFLNPVAQSVTGWTQADAVGLPLEKIFKIINEESRHTVENPVTRTLRESKVVGLANHTLLITNDGTEKPLAIVRRQFMTAMAKSSELRSSLEILPNADYKSGYCRIPSTMPKRSWQP